MPTAFFFSVELILFLQIGVTETNTNALGKIQSMMAYWEVVVSLDRQDMLGSWHQRIVAMCLSQTGHLNAISHHALTRLDPLRGKMLTQ
jgi:hypothetical protein